jgi:hypothetical protein
MSTRRDLLRPAIRLGFALSAVAIALAFALDALGGVAPAFLLAAVAATGLATSWVATGRAMRAVPLPVSTHRRTVVAVRRHVPHAA